MQALVNQQAQSNQQTAAKVASHLEANLNDTRVLISDIEGSISTLENRLQRVTDPESTAQDISALVPVGSRIVDDVQDMNRRLRNVLDRIGSLSGRLHV